MPPSSCSLERLVAGVVLIEGEIVAIEEEAARRGPQDAQEQGQAGDLLTMNFDKRQAFAVLALRVDLRVDRLHERTLAHAARAPQKRIVGGKSVGEPACVFKKRIASRIDPLEEGKRQAGNGCDRKEPAMRRLPEERVAVAGRFGLQWRGRQPLQRRGDPGQLFFLRFRDFLRFCHADSGPFMRLQWGGGPL